MEILTTKIGSDVEDSDEMVIEFDVDLNQKQILDKEDIIGWALWLAYCDEQQHLFCVLSWASVEVTSSSCVSRYLTSSSYDIQPTQFQPPTISYTTYISFQWQHSRSVRKHLYQLQKHLQAESISIVLRSSRSFLTYSCSPLNRILHVINCVIP